MTISDYGSSSVCSWRPTGRFLEDRVKLFASRNCFLAPRLCLGFLLGRGSRSWNIARHSANRLDDFILILTFRRTSNSHNLLGRIRSQTSLLVRLALGSLETLLHLSS